MCGRPRLGAAPAQYGSCKDFQLVYDLVGLDAQAVRARAAADIESAAPPRAPRSCDTSYATEEALPLPL